LPLRWLDWRLGLLEQAIKKFNPLEAP